MRETQQSGQALVAYQASCLPQLQSETGQKIAATTDAWRTFPIVQAKSYSMFACLLPGHQDIDTNVRFVPEADI